MDTLVAFHAPEFEKHPVRSRDVSMIHSDSTLEKLNKN